MNLFTTQEQAFCESLIQDLEDTFGTPIVMYKTSEELFISQNPNFNFAYPNPQSGATVQYIPQSGTFPARIKYLDDNELQLLLATQNRQDEGQDQLRLLLSKPVVRIKVGQAAANFIGDDFKRATFDGSTFVLFRAKRLHGLFTRNYTSFYLQRTD